MKDITRKVMVRKSAEKSALKRDVGMLDFQVTDQKKTPTLPPLIPFPLYRVRRGEPRLTAIDMLWYLLSQAPRQSPGGPRLLR